MRADVEDSAVAAELQYDELIDSDAKVLSLSVSAASGVPSPISVAKARNKYLSNMMDPRDEDQTIPHLQPSESPDATQPLVAAKVEPAGEMPTQAIVPADSDATLSLGGDTKPSRPPVHSGRDVLPQIAGYELIDYLAEGGHGLFTWSCAMSP